VLADAELAGNLLVQLAGRRDCLPNTPACN
jgi:hypothetical protein